mmetsp:Transcript_71731/g.126619  ORF Transcript_71731/g.126619 Transcript_71731/m.126619 type:complete len:207 (+) Transcript_71731:391-1011(+)
MLLQFSAKGAICSLRVAMVLSAFWISLSAVAHGVPPFWSSASSTDVVDALVSRRLARTCNSVSAEEALCKRLALIGSLSETSLSLSTCVCSCSIVFMMVEFNFPISFETVAGRALTSVLVLSSVELMVSTTSLADLIMLLEPGTQLAAFRRFGTALSEVLSIAVAEVIWETSSGAVSFTVFATCVTLSSISVMMLLSWSRYGSSTP